MSGLLKGELCCDGVMDRRWRLDTGYIPHGFASGGAGKWKHANLSHTPRILPPAREECSKHQIVAHSISEVTVDTLFSNQHVPCQPSFWSSSMAQSLGGLPHVATSKALRLYRLDVILHRRIWWNITNHGSVPAVALFRRARCSSNYCQLCEYFPGHFFNQKSQPEL